MRVFAPLTSPEGRGCRSPIADDDNLKSSPFGGQYRATVSVYRYVRPPLRLTARRENLPAGGLPTAYRIHGPNVNVRIKRTKYFDA